MKEFLYKAFAPFQRNSTLLPETYLQPLVEAARSHCYVENTGNKADSLHRRVSLTYEEDIASAYLKVLSPLIKQRRISSPLLAIDFTEEDFYGLHTDAYLHPWTGEEGVEAHYRFAVLSLVDTHKIPLFAVPVHRGMDKAALVASFVELAKRLFRRLRCILLDAGFYSGEVLAVLAKEKYIVRAPRNRRVDRYIDATSPAGWGMFSHAMEWCAERTTKRITTTIVVVRDVRFKKEYIDCSYATNMVLQEGMDYVHLYSKRWQIETNFRMQDQVQIKSKSLVMIIRYFYFMISLLLHSIWLLFWSERMAFNCFKIHAANQLQFGLLGIPYAHSVL